jgi:hypothetical protein
MREIRQRRNQANYLNCGTTESPAYALLAVGAKTLDEKPSAQTKSKKYICDKSTTKSIAGYDWSTSYDIDQIREEAAVSYIVNIGEKQLAGSDAETDYVIVDLDQKNDDGTYHARKFDIAIEVAEFGNDDGEMTCTGNFLGKGDPVEGKFDTKTKTFTPDEDAA